MAIRKQADISRGSNRARVPGGRGPFSLTEPCSAWYRPGRSVGCDWKLVRKGTTRKPSRLFPWELYNMKSDRTELNDLSGEQPEILTRMTRMYEDWAERVGALPWPVMPRVTASPRPGTMHIHEVP